MRRIFKVGNEEKYSGLQVHRGKNNIKISKQYKVGEGRNDTGERKGEKIYVVKEILERVTMSRRKIKVK